MSLYFNLFYKRTSFVGSLASWNPRTENYEDAQVYEITVSNPDNREFIIRDVLIRSIHEKITDFYPIFEIENIPLVIRSGEIKLLIFPIYK